MPRSWLDNTLSRNVLDVPASSAVFERFGLDFCCGGQRLTSLACSEAGIDPEKLCAALDEVAQAPGEEPDWRALDLPTLVRTIIARFHRPLDLELPRLEGLARRVAHHHGPDHPYLVQVLETYLELKDDMLQHMAKEERALFPCIANHAGGTMTAHIAAPIRVMHMEHDRAGRLLQALRALTDNYRLPEGACGSWTALYHGLDAMEKELHLHVHVENNVLFPRALRELG